MVPHMQVSHVGPPTPRDNNNILPLVLLNSCRQTKLGEFHGWSSTMTLHTMTLAFEVTTTIDKNSGDNESEDDRTRDSTCKGRLPSVCVRWIMFEEKYAYLITGISVCAPEI